MTLPKTDVQKKAIIISKGIIRKTPELLAIVIFEFLNSYLLFILFLLPQGHTRKNLYIAGISRKII
jgi:hypothetical protein